MKVIKKQVVIVRDEMKFLAALRAINASVTPAQYSALIETFATCEASKAIGTRMLQAVADPDRVLQVLDEELDRLLGIEVAKYSTTIEIDDPDPVEEEETPIPGYYYRPGDPLQPPSIRLDR